MIKGVANGPPVGDPPDRRPPGEDTLKGRRPRAAAVARAGEAAGRDLRLVVEADPETGAPTYLWVDRETGEVVSRISREDLERINGDPLYAAGDWLDTSA